MKVEPVVLNGLIATEWESSPTGTLGSTLDGRCSLAGLQKHYEVDELLFA
jgi:hypothetical protein